MSRSSIINLMEKNTICIICNILVLCIRSKNYYINIITLISSIFHYEMRFVYINPLLHRFVFTSAAADTADDIWKHCGKGRNCSCKLSNLKKKCSFLSAEWTFKIYLNVVCCKIAVWGKGLIQLRKNISYFLQQLWKI